MKFTTSETVSKGGLSRYRSIESSSRNKEGHGGQQKSPELLDEAFSTKSTQFIH